MVKSAGEQSGLPLDIKRQPPDRYDRAIHGTHRLRDPDVIANPGIYADAIAQLPPVFYDQVGRVWVCSGYREAAEILSNHRVFSSARNHSAEQLRKVGLGRFAPIAEMLSRQMLFTDPPAHTRLRQPLREQFTHKNVRRNVEALQIIVNETLGGLPRRGIIDLVTDFAEPLATRLITHILGMPDRTGDLMRWAEAYETLLGSLSSFPQFSDNSILPALDEALGAFRGIAAQRLAATAEDPIGVLATTLCGDSPRNDETNSDSLDVVAANCLVLAAGGYQTLTHLISRGLLLLRENPAQLSLLKTDPRLIESAVYEIMRIDGSSQYVGRRATADVTLGAYNIKAGETILVLLGAANLDKREFEHPLDFDITRKQHKHLGFGLGNHYCLGAPFAEQMAELAISAFINHYPEYYLLAKDSPTWGLHANTRCLAHARIWVEHRNEAAAAEWRTNSAGALGRPADTRFPHESLRAARWNDTEAPLGTVRCWHHLFELQARLLPTAAAVDYDGQSYSYRDIDRKANAVAWWLRNRGVQPECVVAVVMERSVDVVVAMLAVAKAGGAFMLAEAGCPSERLRLMLREARATLVITDEAALSDVTSLGNAGQVALMPTVDGVSVAPVTGVGPGNSAFVVFTSGTTGVPKAIVNSHEALANLFMAQRRVFAPGPGDRIAQFLSLNFDGCISECVLALLSGATLVVGRPQSFTVGTPLSRFLRHSGITIAIMTPSVWSVIPKDEFPELRIAGFAGERLLARLVRRWSAPGRRLLNLYGPAEAGIWATWYECSAADDDDPPIGYPIINKSAYVMDATGRPAPADEQGELYIGGIGIGRYIGMAQMMDDRFINDPFSPYPERILYKTGDLCVRRRDGALMYRGRRDRQVKIRGQRVELEEVERVLEHAPGVDSCAVGVRNGMLTAVIRPVPGGWNEEAAREYVRSHLHSGMIPGRFLITDESALTLNGKSDLAALISPRDERSGAPSAPSEQRGADKLDHGAAKADEEQRQEIPVAARRTAAAEADATRLTWRAARMFASALQIGQASVKWDSDFFSLGGDSLALTAFLAELEETFNIPIDIDQLLLNPTPARIADYLLTQRTADAAGFQ